MAGNSWTGNTRSAAGGWTCSSARQLDGYLDRFRLETGTLIIFDRRPEAAPITERTTFSKVTSPVGRTITLPRA